MNDYIVFLIFEKKAEKFLETAIKEHCWYVSSPQNQEFVNKYLSKNNKDDSKLLSPFEFNENNLEETFVDIVAEIMDHHNEYTDPPGIKVLDVIGIKTNSHIMKLLENYGFNVLVDRKNGFKAIRTGNCIR